MERIVLWMCYLVDGDKAEESWRGTCLPMMPIQAIDGVVMVGIGRIDKMSKWFGDSTRTLALYAGCWAREDCLERGTTASLGGRFRGSLDMS